MKFFLQLLLRQRRRRPGRNLLSLVGVALSVALVLGTAIGQSGVRTGYKQVTRKIAGPPSLEVRAADANYIATEKVPTLSDVPGIEFVTPVIDGGVRARAKGEIYEIVLVGIPSSPHPVWNTIELTEGQPCANENEAVLSADLARRAGAQVGDQTAILASGQRKYIRATITGLAAPGALQKIVPGSSIVINLDQAQTLFRIPDQAEFLKVAVAEGHEREAVKEALQSRLGDDFKVQVPGELVDIDKVLRSTELALQFSGVLWAALAMFIVVNTLRMNFSERRRQLAILRLLGATEKQIILLHLIEGAAFGILGTAAGIPLGIVMGRGLAGIMANLLRTQVPDAPLSLVVIAVVACVAPLVATFASILPAWASRNVSPAEALGDEDLRRADRPPYRAAMVALAFWGVAAVLLALVTRELIPVELAIVAGLLMLVAFIAVLPVVLGPVVRGAGKLFERVAGIEGRLAAEQLRRRPTRTGLTVGVLVVALAAGLGLGTAVVSNVEDIRAWHRRALAGDFFLNDPTAQNFRSNRGDRIRQALTASPAVEEVMEIGLLQARIGDQPFSCVTADYPSNRPLPWDVGAEQETHIRTSLAAGHTVVSGVLAAKLGIEAGDDVLIQVQGKTHEFHVAALVSDYRQGGMAAFVDRTAAAKRFPIGSARMYIIDLAGVPTETAPEWLAKIAAEEGLVLQSLADVRAELDNLINGVVGALWALLAVGFIVGGFGIANTLAMSVLEQTREFGLLRTIGMTQGQIFRLVSLEALLFAFAGCLAGSAAGLVTAWVIFMANEPVVGHPVAFVLQPTLLAANLAGCFIVSLTAAILPGRRAAKLDLPEALAYE